MWFSVWVVCLLVSVNRRRADAIGDGNVGVQNTELAKEIDRRLLVFSTLDGHLFGVEQLTGNIRWKIKDRSVVRSPKDSADTIIPLFLPNPHDGSLYLVSGGKELLKKLPFTIPELVKSSPCRSTDGILYTGKKKDTWFTLDPTTGRREQILGWDSPNGPTCPVASAEAIYIGRTDYSIMMIDSKHINRKWNVSFYEYTAVAITKESLNNYEFAHFTSSSTGYVITMDRRRATMQWENDFGSPIVAAYILDPEGLISLPFTSLSNHSLNNFALNLMNNENSPNAQKLYPTLYIGEHNEGLYALPSFIDQNIITLLSPGQKPLLLAGPDGSHLPQDYMEYPIPGQNYYIPTDMPDDPLLFQSIPDNWAPMLQFGHYELPEYSKTKLQITGSTRVFSNLITDESVGKESKQIQTEPMQQERVSVRWEDFKYVSTIFITGAVVVMYFLIQKRVEERVSDSSRGSTGSNSVYNMPTQEGLVSIGKIQFKTDHLLGKGCDGTFVYRGEFEGRSVAVKRLLPECFSFADREVSLLRESDAHPNVVRYFCTEQDSLFRYIALELCEATISDYIENNQLIDAITPLEILEQASRGLEHLHSLNIVHRDIKPQNVLLSTAGPSGKARAMISDFGLCKKLQVGRNSFSRKSGITGTDGWIAPEMFSEMHRTTCAVDMFSLGCLFYYVLSNGHHPFGDVLRRQANISSGESDLSNLTGSSWKVELYKPLLKSLISPQPHKRPSCRDVLSYPIFWRNSTILTFLQDVSDRVETASAEDPVVGELEKNARVVVRGNWRNSIDEAVASDLKKYRTYKGNCLRDLLRALRNKKHHFRELDEASQQALGEIPDQFTSYWTNRFPLLLIHTWLTMQTIRHEETFKQFYNPGGHIYPTTLIDYSIHEKEITDNLLDVDDIKFTQNETRAPLGKKNTKRVGSNEEGKVGLYRNLNNTPNRRFNKKRVKENEVPLVWVVPQ